MVKDRIFPFTSKMANSIKVSHSLISFLDQKNLTMFYLVFAGRGFDWLRKQSDLLKLKGFRCSSLTTGSFWIGTVLAKFSFFLSVSFGSSSNFFFKIISKLLLPELPEICRSALPSMHSYHCLFKICFLFLLINSFLCLFPFFSLLSYP